MDWRYLGVGICDECDAASVRLWSPELEGARAVRPPVLCETCRLRRDPEGALAVLVQRPS